ncbi:two-component system sensor histidine kinase/response regulator FitF [Pseudomonas baetica]|uniref:histidine kinase n=1 Tax=Pseudomonas baetica TaxID=674054 RepID=A0ABX4PQJ1_9PSED|nr:PAS domain-containing protein [Pseudomonas baetica]PKA67311.1 two-component system sensor histidine kinase/response regulator FitF [Pseudomonas baetica]PKA69067.1 two-component system sensor histidine kinase/response regulator FitF [Pseudomonas baetica]PTC18801.1 hybrid sensor histidine kinase/response regulator [Pseudomonas baetica]
MLHRLMTFFDRHKVFCYALGIILSVGGGLLLGNLYRAQAEQRYRIDTQAMTEDYAARLGTWNADGFAIGALSMLGRHAQSLKQVISEPAPSTALKVEAATPLKSLALVVGAGHAYVVNQQGVIVAAYDSLGRSVEGLNIGFRPYFKTAMQGKPTVYGAISRTLGQRMFFMAAPVYASSTSQDKAIGVVVAGFDARVLDAELNKTSRHHLQMILSPGGVVLSSNLSSLLLKSDRSWSPETFTGDVRQQFGNYPFTNGVPERLPFDVEQPVVSFEGQRYAVSRTSFDWNDPNGSWAVIRLDSLDAVLSEGQFLLIEGASALLLFLMFWAGLRRLTDAVQHKRDMQRIEQSERRLDLALQSGALGLWDWNVSLGTIINNDVWMRMLGYSQPELDRTFGNGLERWTCLVHPEDREPTMTRLMDHLNHRVGEYRAEYRMRHKSGRWLWVLDIGKVMERDARGEAIRVTGVLQDITQSIEVQRSIVDSQTKLQSMIANIPGVVFRSLPSREREMVFLSDAIETLSGYPAHHFQSGHAYREIVHPDDLEIFNRSLDSTSYILEYRIIMASNEVRWVYDKGQIIQNNGLPQYLDGVIFDISERKAVEAQVQQSRQEAELATQAKSEFLDNMSHEIRTPLNAIIGMAHLVLGMPLERAQRQYIEKMDRAAKGLVSVVNSVLDLSKIEAGKLSIEQVSFDLHEMVQDVLGLMSQRARERNIELRLDIPSHLSRVYIGDPFRLTQVLINLVDNSIKFTDVGHVTLGVRQLSQWSDTAMLCFSVADTGLGMSEEQRIRLFSAFVQADPSISRRYGGTGLGLTISRRIVRLMQGDIWVNSIEGQGSEFKFTAQLKLAHPASTKELSPRPVCWAGNTGGVTTLTDSGMSTCDYAQLLAGARILVVEDNLLNQEVVDGLLQHAKVHVVMTESGEEALNLLMRDTQFDAVLMDCQLPVMDGYETARQIRLHAHLQRLPIIAVTANILADVKGRALSAGMNDCITKPLEIKAFYRTLVCWIKTRELQVLPSVIESPSAAMVSPPESLLALDGSSINTALGLAVVNQDEALYAHLLRIFYADNQQLLEHLWLAHEALDTTAIGRLAHSLRGCAGHIGATALQEAAGLLEEGCTREVDTASLIHRVADCLRPVLADLADFTAEAVPPTAVSRPLINDEKDLQLDRLARLLVEDNAEALSLIDRLCQQDDGAGLWVIQELIYDLEFAQAHALLVHYRQSVTDRMQ